MTRRIWIAGAGLLSGISVWFFWATFLRFEGERCNYGSMAEAIAAVCQKASPGLPRSPVPQEILKLPVTRVLAWLEVHPCHSQSVVFVVEADLAEMTDYLEKTGFPIASWGSGMALTGGLANLAGEHRPDPAKSDYAIAYITGDWSGRRFRANLFQLEPQHRWKLLIAVW